MESTAQLMQTRRTLANRLSAFLPRSVADSLRPLWHWTRELALFFRAGGRVWYNFEIGNWTPSLEMSNGKRLRVVSRSFREFRRFREFRSERRDMVYDWIRGLQDCNILFDIGSANGLEGMHVRHLHNCQVVFVEPFTPSIETILKTIAINGDLFGEITGFEVVHAACGDKEDYSRLFMHQGPIPGSTRNSFDDLEAYCRGGRSDQPVIATQFVKSITVDSLVERYGIGPPSHLKMDVDGFEDKAMAGAINTVKSGAVRSWCLEINGLENEKVIHEMMDEAGYTLVATQEHYPGYEHYTGDHIFVRNDLVSEQETLGVNFPPVRPTR